MSYSLRGIRRIIALLSAFVLVLTAQGMALGDGTETLGPPVDLDVAVGSGVVAAGVGLVDGQPGTINIDVPVGASVEQVLLYWEGQNSTDAFDNTIAVNGDPVTGSVIGGTTKFFNGAWSTTLRADITDGGYVVAGANSLEISGMDFTRRNDGAGVMVIYDDGSDAEIGLVDGNDLAFANFAPTLDTTVPQVFSFAAEDVDRQATLAVFASSVAEEGGPFGFRPSAISITFSNGEVTWIDNELNSTDGDEWDTLVELVTIPAGTTSVEVQALSLDRLGIGGRPASFAWNAAALSVPVTPPDGGGEGCTPGYWKQEHHFDSWVTYSPGDSFSAIFGVDYDKTLLEALKQGGGKDKALGRHAVAALLNSATAGVSYEYSTAEVIDLVQDAYASGDYNGVKGLLEYQNEMGCPLN